MVNEKLEEDEAWEAEGYHGITEEQFNALNFGDPDDSYDEEYYDEEDDFYDSEDYDDEEYDSEDLEEGGKKDEDRK